jgi:hypothetical protein
VKEGLLDYDPYHVLMAVAGERQPAARHSVSLARQRAFLGRISTN